MKCNRCGQCCQNMALDISPKELKQSYLYWDDKKKHKYHIYYEEVYLTYPMLIYKGYDKKIKRYRYRCKHLEFIKGKAVCTIEDIKPKLCSTYGESQRYTMASQPRYSNRNLYPKCVF